MNIERYKKAALVATLMLQATAASAGDAKPSDINRIKSSQTLTIGYRADAFPYSYRDSQGRPTGYAVDFCEAAAKIIQSKLGISGLTIAWREVDDTNRFDEIRQGGIDLECSDTTNTTERLRLVGFGPTYFVGNLAVTVSDKSLIERIDQLRDHC